MRTHRIMLAALALLCLACTSKEKKANLLIDEWIKTHKPMAKHDPARHLAALQYSWHEQQAIDSMMAQLDSMKTYTVLSVNDEIALDPVLKAVYSERMDELINKFNQQMLEVALERLEAAEYTLEVYKDEHGAKHEGEKGYKAGVSYVTAGGEQGEIFFYFDPRLDTIQQVQVLAR